MRTMESQSFQELIKRYIEYNAETRVFNKDCVSELATRFKIKEREIIGWTNGAGPSPEKKQEVIRYIFGIQD